MASFSDEKKRRFSLFMRLPEAQNKVPYIFSFPLPPKQIFRCFILLRRWASDMSLWDITN
jgi:hypothetical protein